MLERSYAYDIGRFLRPDPMQDEYPGISPYAYAANNPLKYVDPDGNKLRFAPGSSAEFRRHFASAVQYLNQIKASAILARLESSERVFYIGENTTLRKASSFNSGTNTILWNPTQGLITTSGNKLSPVIQLIHEADHGDQADRNPQQFNKDVSTPVGAYRNREEERVNRGTETNVARKAGLIGPNEVTRQDHSHDELYKTKGPTSTEQYELPVVEVTGEREEETDP